MLVITKRAGQKLHEIAKNETLESNAPDIRSGVRILLTKSNNGIKDSKCSIGIDRRRKYDQVEDIGGTKLLIDPSTFALLRRTRAILDLSQNGPKDELVLIVEGVSS